MARELAPIESSGTASLAQLYDLQRERLLFRGGHQIVNNVIRAFHRKPFKRFSLPGVGAARDCCLDAHFERAVFR